MKHQPKGLSGDDRSQAPSKCACVPSLAVAAAFIAKGRSLTPKISQRGLREACSRGFWGIDADFSVAAPFSRCCLRVRCQG